MGLSDALAWELGHWHLRAVHTLWSLSPLLCFICVQASTGIQVSGWSGNANTNAGLHILFWHTRWILTLFRSTSTMFGLTHSAFCDEEITAITRIYVYQYVGSRCTLPPHWSCRISMMGV
ncbi:hypothetical protein BJ138DRAFT_834405 [Hygrophoropsis aurantiaca]|uniref:Uncharacterized protein n=1 Tax=Hygrophoropsis aurantiaca TaxID=72124 RepID=A0ACB7ZVE3_9AGAM|nr:hypothetical protein BJ138DRAFT_834405 [Hygrophoropsis aurantiaca]